MCRQKGLSSAWVNSTTRLKLSKAHMESHKYTWIPGTPTWHTATNNAILRITVQHRTIAPCKKRTCSWSSAQRSSCHAAQQVCLWARLSVGASCPHSGCTHTSPCLPRPELRWPACTIPFACCWHPQHSHAFASSVHRQRVCNQALADCMSLRV